MPDTPLTRATEDWADAQLEAEFARLNPEIQRRVALRVLEVDALKREVQRLEEQLEALERAVHNYIAADERYQRRISTEDLRRALNGE